MNTRQSVAGFDFEEYNSGYLAHAKSNGNGNGSTVDSGNDAAPYEVRIVPAEVSVGQLYWRVIGVRHLQPAENTGKHNLYADLLDEDGKRVRDPAIRLQRGWEGQRPDEVAPSVQFDKGDNEPATNIPIDGNQLLWVRVESALPSDKVENIHTKHADERGPNGEIWNSIGHHSFYVVFQRTRAATVTVPGTIPATDPADTPAKPPQGDLPTLQPDDATYLEGGESIAVLTKMLPGQRFVQMWRVRNSGSSSWGDSYRLSCVGGDRLGAPDLVTIPPCAPGNEIAIHLPFTAPTAIGPVHSVWRIANAQGETFGERLWLVIDVETTTGDAIVAAGRNVRPSNTPTQPTPGQGVPRLPEQTAEGGADTMRDPELYAAWKKHIENGFENNQIMFKQLLEGFMNPYWTTVWMYRILFGLGVASFLVAAWLTAFTDKEGFVLVFGGLSALSLLAYFFNRPLQALEENLQFITWLGLVYNSYWTRLVYLNSQPDVQKGLQDATDDAIARIKDLMEAHADRSGKRQNLSKEQ